MPAIRECDLTKGQLRKLNALRKTLGKEIADKAFAEWLASLPEQKPKSGDKNAEAIAELPTPPVLDKIEDYFYPACVAAVVLRASVRTRKASS